MRIRNSALLLVILLLPLSAFPQTTLHVRAGATGSGSGADWTNACPGFTGNCAISNLPRPSIVWVAAGSYGSLTLNRANSGTNVITIRKATPAAHGSDVGWQDSFATGQAVFGDFNLVTDFWVIDGATRNESDWADGPSYGFRARGVVSSTALFGTCSRNVTVQYVDIGAPFSTSFAGPYDRGIFHGGFTAQCQNWIIRRNFVHNVSEAVQLAGSIDILIEFNWLGLAWSKEIIRGQHIARRVIIRFNIMKDGCRDDHAPGNGCTAEVGFFANLGSQPDFNGFQAYGNVIWKTIRQHNSDGCIFAEATDGVIYNNTMVHMGASGTCKLALQSGAGSAIRNNIWFLPNGITSGCQGANTCSDNSLFTSNPPFVNVTAGDFRLTQALAGATLQEPFNVDMFGNTRGADGTFDRGAFEFGPENQPLPASNLKTTVR